MGSASKEWAARRQLALRPVSPGSRLAFERERILVPTVCMQGRGDRRAPVWARPPHVGPAPGAPRSLALFRGSLPCLRDAAAIEQAEAGAGYGLSYGPVVHARP